jgi:neutral ceramidase
MSRATSSCFVTLDLIGVPQLMRRAVAERAEKEFKLPQANLVMNASHTHSGPSLRTTPLTEKDKGNPKAKDAWEYTQKLQNDIVGIIGKALAEVQPARLTWNKARCGFAMNRRRDYTLPPDHPNANKAPNPNGPVDHEVPALRVEAPDGTLRATLCSATPATTPASVSTTTAATTRASRRNTSRSIDPASPPCF